MYFIRAPVPNHAGRLTGGERGSPARRDHGRAAADRAVQQVPSGLPEGVAQPGLLGHVDGAHLDVHGAGPHRGERAGRPADDLGHRRGVGHDGQQHVGLGRHFGRGGRHRPARGGQLGGAAAPEAGDREAGLHEVARDGQAHLAQADHAYSLHRCHFQS
jgi:hypothetical protein